MAGRGRVYRGVGMRLGALALAAMLPFIATAKAQTGETRRAEISVAYCKDCIPFHFRDENGEAAGLIIDLWRLWSEKTGTNIVFKPAPWDKLILMVFDKQVDAHAGLFYNKSRDLFLDYGVALRKTDTHVFTHKALPPATELADLKAYRIGVIEGDFVQGFLKKELPGAAIVGFPDFEEMMGALREGSLRVFAADTPTGIYHLDKSALSVHFQHRAGKPLYQNDWFVAVRQGNAPMLEIINAGMAKITDEEKRQVARRWSGGKSRDTSAGIIIAIDRTYPPFSFVGPDGKATGLLVDMWQLWGETTGAPIRFRVGNWPDTLEAMQSGEADIHAGLFRTAKRETWLALSEPIHEISTALFAGSEADMEGDQVKLADARIGAVAGTYQADYLRTQLPDARALTYGDTESMIIGLLKGEVDYLIQEEPILRATLNRLGLPGKVKRVGRPLFRNAVHGAVAIANRSLQARVNAGFKAIPKSRLAELETRWLPRVGDRFYAKSVGGVDLTPDELAWIHDNPEITLAATPDWPPFEQKHADGEYRGITADMVRLVAERVGLKVKPVFRPWAEALEMVKRGDIDLAPGLYRTEEREPHIAFTRPFVELFDVITTQAERTDIDGPEDLDGMTVAVEEGYAQHEILRRDHPKVKLLLVPGPLEALKAVSVGKADAYVGVHLVTAHVIAKNLLRNLKTVGFFRKKPQYLAMGTAKDRRILRDIMEKGLKSLSEFQRQAVIKRHAEITDAIGKRRVNLSLDEAAWIQEHRKLRLGATRDWPPFEFHDAAGAYKGLASDFVDAVNETLGFEIAPVEKVGWGTPIDQAARRDVDVLAAVVKTPEREKRLNFTKPYMSFPVAIAMRGDAPPIEGLADLADKRVGVIVGNVTQDFLRRDFPDLDRVTRPNVGAALKAVSGGEIDAFVGNLAAISYAIDKLGLSNLKIAAPTPYTHELAMAVRKDWPQLTALLDKALDAMTESEKADIRNRWITIDVKLGLDWATVAKWALPIGGGVLVIIVVIILWNREMGREIAERKAAELAVAEKERQLRAALDNMPGGICMLDADLNVVLFNDRYRQLYDLPEDLLAPGRNIRDAITASATRGSHGDGDLTAIVDNRIRELQSGEEGYSDRNLPGGRTLQVRHAPVAGGGVVLAATDVTESKAAERAVAVKEKQLSTALNSMTDGMYLLDDHLNYVLFNQRYVDLVEITDGSICVGGRVEDVIRVHAERGDYGEGDIEELVARRMIALANEETIDAELVIKGGERILELRKSPIDGGGAVVVISDITARKQAEEAVAENERRFRRILESSPIGINIVDEKGIVQFVNPRTVEMFARSADELIGINARDMYRDPAVRDQITERLLADGSVANVEVEYLRGDGTPFWGLLSLEPAIVVGEANYIAWITDITARKKADEALAEQRAMLELTLENMDQGIILLDKDLTYPLFNRRLLEILDLPEDWYGKPFTAEDAFRFNAERGDYGEGDVEEMVRERLELCKDFKPHQFERTLRDGRIVEVRGVPSPSGDMVTTYTDITPRKKAEQEVADAYNIISSSIQYASRIQRSILPDEDIYSAVFADHFVIWEPRDVVGGDVYWCRMWSDGLLIVAADCTGHGVPGAFMTLISTGALDRAENDVAERDLAALIQRMHQLVQVFLNQHTAQGESDDGLELGACFIAPDMTDLRFVGARFSLFRVDGEDVEEIHGDRKGIGYRGIGAEVEFTEKVVDLDPENPQSFYLTTDGMIDQIGGERKRSFGKRRFKQMLVDFKDRSMRDQRDAILTRFDEYQGDNVRRDDVCVIGFRI